MASASSSSMVLGNLAASRSERLFASHVRSRLILPRVPLSRSELVFSRRRNTTSAIMSSKKKKKKSIKSLAAELCLDRALVLELLREPPPNLLMMSAALPEKIVPTVQEPESKTIESVPEETTVDVVEPEPKRVPVHEMQSRWSAQKRLKKVQVETLERVYNRTKCPTNAMISSIVHVTNLPRKRVVKWFEDKRAEDGVPGHRIPYHRSAPDTVFIN